MELKHITEYNNDNLLMYIYNKSDVVIVEALVYKPEIKKASH